VSFGEYESFDAWYVSGKESVRAQDLGFRSLDGNLTGYVLNDILIRTPVQFALEATCLVLMPVALPYYGVRSLGEGDSLNEPGALPENGLPPESGRDATVRESHGQAPGIAHAVPAAGPTAALASS